MRRLRCTFYARVSTDSDEQTSSIENQISGLIKHAREHDYYLVESGLFSKKTGEQVPFQGYIDEGYSGAKSAKYRKAFRLMIKHAKQGQFDVIITKSVSRFGRNVREMLAYIEELKAIDVGVYFDDIKAYTLNPSDMLKIQIFATLAQEESRAKSDSVQWAKKEAASKGIWSGRVPYGYNMKEGRLIINHEESEIVRLIFKMYLEEAHGVNRIAKDLLLLKVPTQRGGIWTGSLVAKILKNEIYVGTIRLHRTRKVDIYLNKIAKIPEEKQVVLHDDSLRVIDDETFKLVQEERSKRPHITNFQYKTYLEQDEFGAPIEKRVRVGAEKSKDMRHSSAHLFSNLLVCSSCGGRMRYKKQKTTRTTHHYYYCKNNENYGAQVCKHRNLQREEEVLEFVKVEIQKFASDKEAHDFYFNLIMDNKFKAVDFDKQIQMNEMLLQELKLEKEANFKLFSKDLINEDEFSTRAASVNAEIMRLESENKRYVYIDSEIETLRLKYNRFLEDLLHIDLENLTNAVLRKFIVGIDIGTFYVKNEKKEQLRSIRWKFIDEDSVDIIEEHAKRFVESEGLNILEKILLNNKDDNHTH